MNITLPFTEIQKPKEKAIRLNYKQDKFIFSRDKYICIKGTWGCGKSLAGLLSADKECQEFPNNLYLVIRKEWVDLRDSTLRDWNDMIGKPVVNNEVKYKNGSILMFRHGDDLNALKNSNLGGALMVQAEEMVEEDFWFIQGRLRRKEGSRQLRLECNYDGHNWIYELFNKQKVGTLITTNTYDNKENLPPDYIPNLEAMPERIKRVHLIGSDDYSDGLVWTEFDESRHACESYEIPDEWKVAFALDHGHNHPTAVLFGAVDYDGNLLVYNEHYEAGKPIEYHAKRIKEIEPDYNRLDQIIDHTTRFKTLQNGARVYSIMEAYGDYGYSFRPSISDQFAGINFVSKLFIDNKIKIFSDKCPNLMREIKNWKYPKPKPNLENARPDEPIRKNDDACKALIYLASGHFDATQKAVAPTPRGSVREYELACQKQGLDFDESD